MKNIFFLSVLFQKFLDHNQITFHIFWSPPLCFESNFRQSFIQFFQISWFFFCNSQNIITLDFSLNYNHGKKDTPAIKEVLWKWGHIVRVKPMLPVSYMSLYVFFGSTNFEDDPIVWDSNLSYMHTEYSGSSGRIFLDLQLWHLLISPLFFELRFMESFSQNLYDVKESLFLLLLICNVFRH